MDRARSRHRVRQVGRAEGRPEDLPVDARRRVLRRRRGVRARRTSSGPWSTGTRRRSRSTTTARASRSTERLPPGVNLQSTKMGMHEWATPTTTTRPSGARCSTSSLKERFKKLNIEVELGFTAEQTDERGAALPQLRRADGVRRPSCASSATPASTSARWSASPSRRTARRPSCARASRRRR